MASSSEADQARSETVVQQRIVFFHPDLGIGGAERLVVDAAVGLQNLGHKVTIFTSHCDPRHCFEEARDGTLDVRVHGNSLFPSTILNRFHILLAILRQMHLVVKIVAFSNELRDLRPTVFVVDQLSACVPLLRWLYPVRQRIMFYCHFPDQLLAKRDEAGLLSLLKFAYRYPFDWFEGWSMSASDRIVVNSNFTKSIARRVFPAIDNLGVIYPCVAVAIKDEEEKPQESEAPLWPNIRILLSINRFERKKDVSLAIRAFHALPPTIRRSTRLVLAGGYDARVSENVQYHKELVSLAESLNLNTATAKTVPTALAIPSTIEVLFLLSIPGVFKSTLLRAASLLIYTPTNEHFGIVPVEAMHEGVPVLAANTGGPLETVVEGETGWLRHPNDVAEWTAVMRKVLSELSTDELVRMGRKGKERVKTDFSRTIMAERFEDEIVDMLARPRPIFIEWRDILLALGVAGIFLTALFTVVFKASYGQARPQRSHATRRKAEL